MWVLLGSGIWSLFRIIAQGYFGAQLLGHTQTQQTYGFGTNPFCSLIGVFIASNIIASSIEHSQWIKAFKNSLLFKSLSESDAAARSKSFPHSCSFNWLSSNGATLSDTHPFGSGSTHPPSSWWGRRRSDTRTDSHMYYGFKRINDIIALINHDPIVC